MRSLDIGCGKAPYNIFDCSEVHGIDLYDESSIPLFQLKNWHNVILNQELLTYRKCDLATENIPHPDNFFDVVTAIDVLEHIPRLIYHPSQRFAFVELMNNIWRVLKPGGLFFSCTPFYPHPEAFSDPTHVNFLTTQTFTQYFMEPGQYGFYGAFDVKQISEVGCKLHVYLVKRVIGSLVTKD